MSGSPGTGGSNARNSTSLDGRQPRSTEGRQHGNIDRARRRSKLYNALRAARASDLKVRKAAEETAAYGQRLHPQERPLEDVTGKQWRQRWMLSVAVVLLLGEIGKEGQRIGSFRLTSLVRSR